MELQVKKKIPLSGGMAGGSADAAAALVACDALWRIGLGREELDVLAARLGADVTFALHGGTAIGTGRGERLTPALISGQYHWCLPFLMKDFPRLRFMRSAIDCARVEIQAPTVAEDLMAALRRGDPVAVGKGNAK